MLGEYNNIDVSFRHRICYYFRHRATVTYTVFTVLLFKIAVSAMLVAGDVVTRNNGGVRLLPTHNGQRSAVI